MAFIEKNCAVVTFHCASTATIIGPITRAPLITVELSEIAPGRSFGGTRVVSIDDQPGICSALPMPTPSWAAKISQIATSLAAKNASKSEHMSWSSCIDTRNFLRFTRSAMTPPGIDNSRIGPS